MSVDFIIDVMRENEKNDAIVWRDRVYSYAWLLERYQSWCDRLSRDGLKAGSVAVVEADFSPNSIALMLALLSRECIFVPLTRSVGANRDEFIKIAQGEVLFSVDDKDHATMSPLPYKAGHAMYRTLRERQHPGLVLFSSGSTGKSKASVHDMTGIVDKFRVRRHTLRTITFLLYDHIGGVNTLLYILANGGFVVTVEDRSTDSVFNAIEKYKVQLLPTSPTFINLILLSEVYERYNINSLELITYGTEPMLESTLVQFNTLFPDIKLLQTYGLSEVGILRSKSRSSDSPWVKVGGEGFETRVVDDMLEIKAKSAMLGYLNAPSPFTEDGWFITGDAVEIDGEYIRILGRKSELINVGGEKVYPEEVESVISELDNVAEVTVFGEKNPIIGNMVCAKVRLKEPEDPKTFTSRLKHHCADRVQKFKVPVKVTLDGQKQYSERFKKRRR